MIKCAKCGSASVRRSHDGLSIVCGYCGQPITTERTRVPEPGRISAAECEKCAKDLPGTSISRPLLTRAAATLRALEQETADLARARYKEAERASKAESELGKLRFAVNRNWELAKQATRRAEKAEAALNALRAEMPDCDECEIHLREHLTTERDEWKADFLKLREETVPLLEIARCQQSVWAAGVKFATYVDGSFGIRDQYADEFFATFHEWTVQAWQAAERAAWEHFAKPYRERVEAAGYRLRLHFGESGVCPVRVTESDGSCHYEQPMKRGGYPTREAIEEETAWAEAHPANPPAALDSSEQKVCSCGHVHDGCEGCADELTSYAQDPCRKCRNLHTPEECRYTPAPQETCPYCGKRCAND